MNVPGSVKITSRGFMAMAVVMLLLTPLTALSAQEKEKVKHKESDAPKPTPVQKHSTSTSTTTQKTSSSGRTDGTNTRSRSHSESTATKGSTSTTGNTGQTVTSQKTNRVRTTERIDTRTRENRTVIVRPGITRGTTGKVEVYRGHNGSEARFRHDGTIHEVHARDMTIIHLPGGSRRVVVERADHSRVVAYRGGYGYVQRPFLFRGREFGSRTYFYNGRPYAAYYQRYPYRGLFLEGYRPYRYYRPAFYGWAYNPWRSPVRYSWGFAGDPWYGYYGGYFSPYSVYPSASFWLTDFLISSSLQAAYQQ